MPVTDRPATDTPVTVVVPTFREVENLPALTERLAAVRARQLPALVALLMDDASGDGSAEWVAASAPPWVELVERDGVRGLSPAVLEGIERAVTPLVVVMDADLSHPPEKIPEMVAALEEGADFVVGSRYAAGGVIDEDWGLLRAIASRLATGLARPLTGVRDPMAGFLAFRRALVAEASGIDPIGFKIGLELLVKCRPRRVVEVPIRFSDRHAGRSKLGAREQLNYLRHLGRLYRHRLARSARRRG